MCSNLIRLKIFCMKNAIRFEINEAMGTVSFTKFYEEEYRCYAKRFVESIIAIELMKNIEYFMLYLKRYFKEEV